MTIRHLKGLVARAMDYSEGCNYSQSSMYLQRKVFHSLIEFAKRSRKLHGRNYFRYRFNLCNFLMTTVNGCPGKGNARIQSELKFPGYYASCCTLIPSASLKRILILM